MLYLHWLSFCSRNTPSLSASWPLHWQLEFLLCLHGYIPCIIQISSKKFFSTITQLKVVTQSFYQTILFLYSMQSSNYYLKLSWLNICLFSIFLYVTMRARTLHTWSLLYLRMFIGNKICCRIEWVINEWTNTKSDDYVVVWHMLLKRERSTKFYGISKKGTTNSDKNF